MDTALSTFRGKSWCLVEPTKQHKNAQQNQHSRPTHILLSTLRHLWFFDLFSSTSSFYSGKSLTPPTSETSHFCNSTAVHPAGGTSDKSTEDLNEALLLFSWTSKDRRWEITRTWWRGQERRRTTFLKWLTCTNVPAICRLGEVQRALNYAAPPQDPLAIINTFIKSSLFCFNFQTPFHFSQLTSYIHY